VPNSLQSELQSQHNPCQYCSSQSVEDTWEGASADGRRLARAERECGLEGLCWSRRTGESTSPNPAPATLAQPLRHEIRLLNGTMFLLLRAVK
jgi:hypothetical protein